MSPKLENISMKAKKISRFHQFRSLAVIGGFLDGLKISFSEGLNCIIGARGTGKTTILEFIRYAMDAVPSGENATSSRKRIDSIVSKNLCGGRVELEVETKDGLSYFITRADGEEPVVLDAKRKPTSISVRNGLFRADIYSQNDVETIADQGRYQLELIDGFEAVQVAEIETRIEELRGKLRGGTGELERLRQKLSGLDESLKKLPDIETRLQDLAAGVSDCQEEINEAHAAKSARDREGRVLKNVGAQLNAIREGLFSLEGMMLQNVRSQIGKDLLNGANGGLLKKLTEELEDCAGDVDRNIQAAMNRMDQFGAVLVDVGEQLEMDHREQALVFQRLMDNHRAYQTQSAERSNLEKLRNELAEKKQERSRIAQRIAALEKERNRLLVALSEHRDELFEVRQEVVNRLNQALSPSIRIRLEQFGDASGYQEFLEGALRNQGLRQGVVAQKIVRSLSPDQFAGLLRNRDTQGLVERADLNPDQAAKVIATLATEPALYEIETIELRDAPTIQLKDGAEYKDSALLSTGQKCTTILPILLLESENPLLVDQPEDNLDNRFIFETVVGSIHKVKQARQLIFVTHNPNIPVLGEASRVFVMESNGEHGGKHLEGGVDECKTSIVTLLEGGEEAFKKRGQRYNFTGA